MTPIFDHASRIAKNYRGEANLMKILSVRSDRPCLAERCAYRKPNPLVSERDRMMLRATGDVCKLIWCAFAGLFWCRGALQSEILVLRHQLNVLRRKSHARSAFSGSDRMVFAGLYALVPNVVDALKIIKPGHRDPLAPGRLSSLLAMEIAVPRRDRSRKPPRRISH